MDTTTTEPLPAPWVVLRAVPQPALRVFCFPYAGAGTAAYARWAAALPADWELLALQLPGRGTRCGEAPLHRFQQAQHEAWRGLPERLDRPSLFVGHSLGAILAYEVARQWCAVAGAARPAPLLGLAVSACVAPRHWPTERGRALAQLDRAGLVDALRGYNGTPAEVFEDDDVLDLLLPSLKADFDLVASYRYCGRAALPLPLLVLHGADDPHVDDARLAGWADEALGGCTLKRLPGDHFFFEGQEARIIRLLADQVLAAGCGERAAP